MSVSIFSGKKIVYFLVVSSGLFSVSKVGIHFDCQATDAIIPDFSSLSRSSSL